MKLAPKPQVVETLPKRGPSSPASVQGPAKPKVLPKSQIVKPPKPATKPPTVQPVVAKAYPQARPQKTKKPSVKSGQARKRRPRGAPLWSPQDEPTPMVSPAGPEPVSTPVVGAEVPSGGGRSGPAMPLFIPEIDLGERFPEVKSASVVAKFEIKPDGTFAVTLTEGTQNLDADLFILETLRSQSKWSPRLKDGVATEDTRTVDLDIER